MAQPLTSALPFREVGLIVLCACALYMLLAIVSYSPMDPAWSFAGTDLVVTNLVGRSGAWAADVILFVFGWVAYALPIALFVTAIRLVRARHAQGSWLLFGIRVSGWVAMTVGICILARLHISAPGTLPAGAGGAVGDFLVQGGLPILNWIGLTLIALAMLLAGSQFALGYAWAHITETTGRTIYRCATSAVVAFERLVDRIGRYRRRRPTARVKRKRPATDSTNGQTRKSLSIVKKTTTPSPSPRVRQQRLFDLKTPAELPDLNLLDDVPGGQIPGFAKESLEAMSRMLELKLKDFGIEAEVVSVLPGPVITRFELQPAPGVKVSKITALVKDLARSLAVTSVRIVEVIPGKSVVGIEIPNEQRETVHLKDVLSSKAYQDARSPLTLALGKDIMGEPVLADIAKMPHLLVAGTTGSGKSVGVNAMLLSMLYKCSPDELRLILVDPKMLELAVYEGIPHLLTPVVTDMKEAAAALNWCVGEMERRYRLMAALGVRNLAGYNRRVTQAQKACKPLLDPLHVAEDPAEGGDEPAELSQLPLIVVVIDEFADMMMIVGKKVEQLIARIAQKARAAGIHLVLATQRPSVDVITGLIKANIPTRIAFQVSSKVDSRTILDQGGAEQLLGHGDMLYLPPGSGLPVRVHGAFVSDDEVHAVVADWKQRGGADYVTDVLIGGTAETDFAAVMDDTETDEPLYDEAVAFVLESRRASISAVQRKLRIGYNRAARIIEAMEAAGIVGAMNSNGSRELLVPARD